MIFTARVERVKPLVHGHEEYVPEGAQRGRGPRPDGQRLRLRVVDEDRCLVAEPVGHE